MFKRRKLNKCLYEFDEVCIISDTDLEKLGPINEDCYIDFKIRNGDCLRYRFNRHNKTARLYHIDGKSCPGVTGTKILRAVDYISKRLGVKYVEVNDASNIDGLSLAWLNLIRYNKTWYERHGYIPEDYYQYEISKNRLLNTRLQHGQTLRESYIPFLNDRKDVEKLLKLLQNNEYFQFINKSLKKFRKYFVFDQDEFDQCECTNGNRE